MRTLALDCVRQLLVWPGLTEAAQRPALCALLAAFHKDAPLQLEGEREPASSLLALCSTRVAWPVTDCLP